MTRDARRRLVRIGSVGLTLVAAAGMVWLLPILDRRDSSLPDYDAVHAFDPSREGGHLLPNLDEWMQGGGRGSRVRIVTNSKGFRNRKEFTYETPANTCRILIVGDSFVDGMRTDQDATIGALLERELKDRAANASYADFEVMVSGHNNPADAWYGFQEHARKYSPKLVILGITLGNDLSWQGYRRWMQPVVAADGSTRLRFDASSMEVARFNEKILLPPSSFDPESPWELLTSAEMRVRRLFSARFAFAGYSIPLFTAPWWSRRREVHAADFFLSLGIFCRPSMTEVEIWFEDLDQVLAGFAAEVARSGGQLVVLVFPERLQVNPDEWNLTRRAYGLKGDAFDLDYPDRRIAATCRRLRLPVLDLTDAFRERIRAGEGPLYRPRGDMHFNEAGQSVAAASLASYLSRTLLR
jgi:hypothetical protein